MAEAMRAHGATRGADVGHVAAPLDGRLLTEQEATELLAVSRALLFRLRRRGLPVVRLGGAVRYPEALLRDWLAGQVVRGDSPATTEAKPEQPRRRGRPRKAAV